MPSTKRIILPDSSFSSPTSGAANEGAEESSPVSHATPLRTVARDRAADREDITLSTELRCIAENDASFEDSASQAGSFSTRAIAPTPRSSNRLRDFTINKLNFQFRRLYGRDREIATLLECLRKDEAQKGTSKQQIPERKRQIIFIHGESGTGKTALAETLRKPVVQRGGVFSRGKFDFCQRSTPYQGIASACQDVCSRLAALRRENVQAFRKGCDEIRSRLGDELGLISQAVPLLADLMAEDQRQEARPSLLQPPGPQKDHHTVDNKPAADESSDPTNMSKEARHRVVYAFQRLICAFSTVFETVVMVIDDLQWADVASLDLLQAIASDEYTSNVILVGIYRTNEVNTSHVVAKFIRDCRQDSTDGTSARFAMTEISVGNLDLASTHSLIQEVLRSSEADTLRLAELCHKKTRGNVFFLLQYLVLLNDRSLLTFNFGLLRWEWDVADIELRTNATENVVNLLRSKMKGLEESEAKALELAACFGNTFSIDTYTIAWNEIYGNHASKKEEGPVIENEQTPVTSIVDSLITLGFLERVRENYLKFTHDLIQEASCSLSSILARRELCRRVGTVLVSKLDSDQLNSAILLVVHLLNEGDPPREESKRVELAELNRRAVRVSMSIADFHASARYATYAIGQLDDEKWRKHRDLTLDLYSSGAEAEGLLGNVHQMEFYYKQVVAQERILLHEKLRVYNAYCSSVAGQGRPRDAANLAMEVLGKMKIYLPRSKGAFVWHLAKDFLWVKKMTKSGKLDAFENLHMDEDPVRVQIANFMDQLALFCYLCGDELFLSVNFLAMRRTFQHGINAHSSMGMSGVGMAMAALGEFQAAAVLGRYAVKLSESSVSMLQCRALLCVYGFCLHWTEPLRQSTKPLVRSYDLGLRSGDTDNAIYAILTYANVCVVTSHNFKMTAEDLKVYSRQARNLKQEFPRRFLLLWLEYCENMLAETETDRLSLYGARVSYEQVEEWKRADKTFQQQYVILQGMLYTIYGCHEKGADLALQEGTNILMKTFPGSCLAYYDILGKGLSCFAMARKTKQRKFVRVAKTMHRRVKRWTAKGNPNVSHFDALFDAELAIIQGKPFNAISKYETAILLSARSGLLVDAALCSERFAEFLLEQDRREDAKRRFEQAISYYKEVGAFRKASVLSQEQVALWPPPSGILAITD